MRGGAAVPENGGGSEERGGAAEERVGAAEETASTSRSGHSGADQTQNRGTCTAPLLRVGWYAEVPAPLLCVNCEKETFF